MALVWMDDQGEARMVLRDKSGQAIVEYLLLMVVVIILANTFFRSSAFTDNMGQNSSFFLTLRDELEFSYRFASQYTGPSEFGTVLPANGVGHYSYFQSNRNGEEENESRFFAPLEKEE